MVYLPIVERELRLAARRPGTYRTRSWAALAAVGIALAMVLSFRQSPAQLGRALFGVLTMLAFGCCLLAGVRYTADSLSEEKREGTLGFLFLTDLRGYDVVFGKLAVSSLDAVYALLAALPVLGLPVLAGGVTGLEFWRTSLLLVNTLVFSLAVGLAVSALGRNERSVMLATFFVVGFFAIGLPALWKLATTMADSRWFDFFFLLPSPAYAFKMAGSYSQIGAAEYWASMGAILGVTICCLGAASLLLPRVFQEQGVWTGGGRLGERIGRLRFLNPARRKAWWEAQRDANPFLWVAVRDRMPKVFLGLFIALLIGFSLWAYPVLVKKTAAFMGFAIFGSYGLHALLKFLITAEACRRLNDDKRSGVLELLLGTRLTMKSIVRAQAIALMRLFWLPIGLLVVLNLVWIEALNEKEPTLVILGGAVILVFDFYALTWVGMREALRGQRYHRAVVGALGRVLVPGWAVLAVFLFVSINGRMSSETAQAFFFWWFVACAGFDLWLVAWAKVGIQSERPHGGPLKRWVWVPVQSGRARIERGE